MIAIKPHYYYHLKYQYNKVFQIIMDIFIRLIFCDLIIQDYDLFSYLSIMLSLLISRRLEAHARGRATFPQ